MPKSAKAKNFEDERPRPHIGNLASHIKSKHPVQYETGQALMNANLEAGLEAETISVPYTGGYSASSVAKFAEYIANADKSVRDQKGFYMVFAAWVVEADLPWTTGETPGIKHVFDYLGSKFALLTDTTRCLITLSMN